MTLNEDYKFLISWEKIRESIDWWIYYSVMISKKYIKNIKESIIKILKKENINTKKLEIIDLWDHYINDLYIEMNIEEYNNFSKKNEERLLKRKENLENRLEKVKVKNSILVELLEIKQKLKDLNSLWDTSKNEFIYKHLNTTYKDFTNRYWYIFIDSREIFDSIKNHWLFSEIIREDEKRVICKTTIWWFVIFIHFWSKWQLNLFKKEIKNSISTSWKRSPLFKRSFIRRESIDIKVNNKKETTKEKDNSWVIDVNKIDVTNLSERDIQMIENYNKALEVQKMKLKEKWFDSLYQTRTKTWNIKRKRLSWKKRIVSDSESILYELT